MCLASHHFQLDEGPHEYIEDLEIRAVWKGLTTSPLCFVELTVVAEMGSRLSAKTRIFLDGTFVAPSSRLLTHSYLSQLCMPTFLEYTRSTSTRRASLIRTRGPCTSCRRSFVRIHKRRPCERTDRLDQSTLRSRRVLTRIQVVSSPCMRYIPRPQLLHNTQPRHTGKQLSSIAPLGLERGTMDCIVSSLIHGCGLNDDTLVTAKQLDRIRRMKSKYAA